MTLIYSEQKIHLKDDAPLRFLNDAFPDGVPVKSLNSYLSLNGTDCYEFNPDVLPQGWCLDLLGRAIVSNPYCYIQYYGLYSYGIVPIPLEWCQ